MPVSTPAVVGRAIATLQTVVLVRRPYGVHAGVYLKVRVQPSGVDIGYARAPAALRVYRTLV